MKIALILLTALCCFCIKSEATQLPAKGFLIYTDYPSKYVEACEYAGLQTGGAIYSTVQRPDGKSLQLANGGLLITVDYPPLKPGAEEFKDVARLKIGKIQKLLSQYPQYKEQLQGAMTKWHKAAENFKQQPKPTPATIIIPDNEEPDTPDEKLSFVTSEGTKYDNVILTSSDPTGISVRIESGIEHIDFERLPKELQQHFHYDPSQAAAYRQKYIEAQQARAQMQKQFTAATEQVNINELEKDWDKQLDSIDAKIATIKHKLQTARSLDSTSGIFVGADKMQFQTDIRQGSCLD
jgi:hypothetical protein